MMIHAYREFYLDKAQRATGDIFDYGINICSICGSDFMKMFSASSAAKRMENGEPLYLSGKSGIDMAAEIISEVKGIEVCIEPVERYKRSKEYWIGWALCYYQWFSCRSYEEIFRAISYGDMDRLYETLHEADVTKFADIADKAVRAYYTETNLKHMRNICRLTQSELSKEACVSLRSIQMYEQRKKDINRAGAETVYRLANVLGCTMEDLIEK